MNYFYRKLGEMIAPVIAPYAPIKMLTPKILAEVLSFTDRQQLDQFQLVSRQFYQLISQTFIQHPYRRFHQLDVQIDSAKESPPCKVDFKESKSHLLFLSFDECLDMFRDHTNARFNRVRLLFARKLPPEYMEEVDEFIAAFTQLTHLWQGQKLEVFMMPWDRQKAGHFKRIFTNFAEGSGELWISTPERNDFPLQIVFDYPDVKSTNFVRVDAYQPPANFMSEAGGLLNYLHKPHSKTLWLTFVRGGDQLFFKQLMAELRKRFQSAASPSPYHLFLIGLHSASFYSVKPYMIDNDSTGERFKVLKEPGDYNIGYRVVRWKIKDIKLKKKVKASNNQKANGTNDTSFKSEFSTMHSMGSFGEDQGNFRFSFC